MGRALGMTEQEFWLATYAMVAILYRIKELEWGRRRDHFSAILIAMKVSSNTKTYTGEDILDMIYPKLNEDVTVTVDPDRGAGGDWRALRKSLRGSL